MCAARQLAYLVFLTFYTFVVLVRMYPTPRWQEVYVTAFIATLGIEKCREILKSEPVTLRWAPKWYSLDKNPRKFGVYIGTSEQH